MQNQYEEDEKEELYKKQLESLKDEKKKQSQRNEKIKQILSHEGHRNAKLVSEEAKLLKVKVYLLLNEMIEIKLISFYNYLKPNLI